MNFPKLTRKLSILVLPIVISSSVALPVSVYAQRNPVKPVSREQVMTAMVHTVCKNYPVNSKKYKDCASITVATVLAANKLKVSATGVNLKNESQLRQFIFSTSDKLLEDSAFVSVVVSTSKSFSRQEQVFIIYNSILNYGKLKQARYL